MSAALRGLLAHPRSYEQLGGCQVGDLAHHQSPPGCHGSLEALQRAAAALHHHPVIGVMLLLPVLAETLKDHGLWVLFATPPGRPLFLNDACLGLLPMRTLGDLCDVACRESHHLTLTPSTGGSLSHELHSPRGCCQRLLPTQSWPASSVLGQGHCVVLLHRLSQTLAAILNITPAIIHFENGRVTQSLSMWTL